MLTTTYATGFLAFFAVKTATALILALPVVATWAILTLTRNSDLKP